MRVPLILMVCASAVLLTLTPHGFAQNVAPASGTPSDPRFVAAQKVFEALTDAERKAIQIDLTFATTFTGAATGGFGSLTFAALQRFERENKLSEDGILTTEERKLLATRADVARKSVGFSLIADGRSGARIGVPVTLLPKTTALPRSATRWQSEDGKATLETLAHAAGSETLPQLFDRAQAPQPGRTVTYKLLRPDFMVITSETATAKSYRRVSAGPDGALRGFVLTYEKSLAPRFDRMAVAIANTFDAFPAGSEPVIAAGTRATPPPSQPLPAQPVADRLLTGIAVGPDRLVTSAVALKGCGTLTVQLPAGRMPARIVRQDADSSLALLSVQGMQADAVPLASSSDDGLSVLGAAWSDRTITVLIAPAAMSSSTHVEAPLQPGQAGAGLFNPQGSLSAIVLDDPAGRRQVAGVIPTARYAAASAATIRRFLEADTVNRPETARAQPASARRRSVFPVLCAP